MDSAVHLVQELDGIRIIVMRLMNCFSEFQVGNYDYVDCGGFSCWRNLPINEEQGETAVLADYK